MQSPSYNINDSLQHKFNVLKLQKYFHLKLLNRGEKYFYVSTFFSQQLSDFSPQAQVIRR